MDSIITLHHEVLKMTLNNEYTVGDESVRLQIVDQPPELLHAKRKICPYPALQLTYTHDSAQEDDLCVVPILVRCDTMAEVPEFFKGSVRKPIAPGRVVLFKKLKIMATSKEQDTEFALRFELRRYIGETYKVLQSITSTSMRAVQQRCMCGRKPIPPKVLEVIPPIGPAKGSTRIAILGEHFPQSAMLRVRFGDIEVVPEFLGPGTLVCVTPSHIPGDVAVRVSAREGKWSSEACTFTYTQ